MKSLDIMTELMRRYAAAVKQYETYKRWEPEEGQDPWDNPNYCPSAAYIRRLGYVLRELSLEIDQSLGRANWDESEADA